MPLFLPHLHGARMETETYRQPGQGGVKCPCPKEIWSLAQSLVARADVLRTQVWTSQRQSLSSHGAQEAERWTQGRREGVTTPSFACWLLPSVPRLSTWSSPHLSCLDYCQGLLTAMAAIVSLFNCPPYKLRADPVTPLLKPRVRIHILLCSEFCVWHSQP